MGLIGRRRSAIGEGCIPSQRSSSHRAPVRHQAPCMPNPGDRDAHVSLFFVDREPCCARDVTRRSLHPRCNDLKDPAPTPCEIDSCSAFESDARDRAAIRAARFATRASDLLFNRGLCTNVMVHCRPFVTEI